MKPRDLVFVRLAVSRQPIAEDSIDNTATNPAHTVQECTERPEQQKKEFAQREREHELSHAIVRLLQSLHQHSQALAEISLVTRHSQVHPQVQVLVLTIGGLQNQQATFKP